MPLLCRSWSYIDSCLLRRERCRSKRYGLPLIGFQRFHHESRIVEAIWYVNRWLRQHKQIDRTRPTQIDMRIARWREISDLDRYGKCRAPRDVQCAASSFLNRYHREINRGKI